MKLAFLILSIFTVIAEGASAASFPCSGGKTASSASDVQALFSEVLGVENVKPGMTLAEMPGNGNRVFLKIKRAATFQLQINHRGYKGDLPAKVCSKTDSKGRPALVASVDASSLGYGSYAVTITNPKNKKDQVYMLGSGMLGQVIYYDYQVTSAAR